jgi:hypothetical protein
MMGIIDYDDRISSLKPFIKAFEKAGVKPEINVSRFAEF